MREFDATNGRHSVRSRSAYVVWSTSCVGKLRGWCVEKGCVAPEYDNGLLGRLSNMFGTTADGDDFEPLIRSTRG